VLGLYQVVDGRLASATVSKWNIRALAAFLANAR